MAVHASEPISHDLARRHVWVLDDFLFFLSEIKPKGLGLYMDFKNYFEATKP